MEAHKFKLGASVLLTRNSFNRMVAFGNYEVTCSCIYQVPNKMRSLLSLHTVLRGIQLGGCIST
jgi:hypothetical protein